MTKLSAPDQRILRVYKPDGRLQHTRDFTNVSRVDSHIEIQNMMAKWRYSQGYRFFWAREDTTNVKK